MRLQRLPVLLATLAPACVEPRAPTDTTACADYAEAVQPVLDTACGPCHGTVRSEGGFNVHTLAGLLARDEAGRPRVVAGDPNSLALRHARGEDNHAPASADAIAVLTEFVVTCRLNPMRTEATHPRAWIDRASPESHIAVLNQNDWDFDLCSDCHGPPTDRGGGATGKSCYTCHLEGPTGCSTCHGTIGQVAPPPDASGNIVLSARGVGLHALHLNGGPTLDLAVACAECHRVPEDWRAIGHVFGRRRDRDPPPAEVTFGAAANRSLAGHESWRTLPAWYEPTEGRCYNVYCHGSVLGDATLPVPAWTEASGAAACDRCHRLPPPGHFPGLTLADCATCHGRVVSNVPHDERLDFVEPALHLDGALAIGDGSGTCSACHGGAANAAPPQALDGETATSAAPVGLHQVHVVAGNLRGPLACDDCHPTFTGATFAERYASPGHVDSLPPAEVFEAGSGIADSEGATPAYDRDSATCGGVYCHGNGTRVAADATPGLVRTVSWTGATGPLSCGDCHGLPPLTPAHPVQLGPDPITVANCFACHPLTIDAGGAILFNSRGQSTHINGDLD
jgi:predicted CxxxxCH...CXXCH cytochrome family protein